MVRSHTFTHSLSAYRHERCKAAGVIVQACPEASCSSVRFVLTLYPVIFAGQITLETLLILAFRKSPKTDHTLMTCWV